jgi:hypothetical protein
MRSRLFFKRRQRQMATVAAPVEAIPGAIAAQHITKPERHIHLGAFHHQQRTDTLFEGDRNMPSFAADTARRQRRDDAKRSK